MDRKLYESYVQILKEELIPAMGCTEPIALAYAAAKAQELLGQPAKHVRVQASGSIIKNVKSVVVPNTGHMKGIAVAAAAGIVAGDPSLELEVISKVGPEQVKEISKFIEEVPVDVEALDDGHVFDILVTLKGESSSSAVRISDFHTNIVYLEQNGKVLLDNTASECEENLTDRSVMSMEGILEFATTANLDDVKDVLQRQIDYNWAIAQEGMAGNYGANIGKVMLKVNGDSLRNRACAMAAAGSDARMDGCELPVVINSGSGNQGMTASIPVIVYAKEMGATQEQLYRALLVSNLTAIHQKTGVGRLSAYCGAVCAGAGAGAGIAYLHGASQEEITQTVVNALAVASGMICDGAKASCAAKIAVSVNGGILGYEMFIQGQKFCTGDGIVGVEVEETIGNVGRLASEGMYDTNKEIIGIMTGK